MSAEMSRPRAEGDRRGANQEVSPSPLQDLSLGAQPQSSAVADSNSVQESRSSAEATLDQNPWATSITNEVLRSRTMLTPDREGTQNSDFFGHPVFAWGLSVLATCTAGWSIYSGAGAAVTALLNGTALPKGGGDALVMGGAAAFMALGSLVIWGVSHARPRAISLNDAADSLNGDAGKLIPSLSAPLRDGLEQLCQSSGRTGRLIEATNLVTLLQNTGSLEERTVAGTVLLPLLANAYLSGTELYRGVYKAYLNDLVQFTSTSSDVGRNARLIKMLIDPRLSPLLPSSEHAANTAFVDDLFGMIRDGCRDAALERTLFMISLYPLVPSGAVVEENVLSEILESMREVDPQHRAFVSSLLLNSQIQLDQHLTGELRKILEETVI